MGKYIGPKNKLSRREGVNLFDKAKNPLSRRNYPPGVHGPKGYPRLTTYGIQLREKQKARRIYGIREKQFRNYFDKALAKEGDTGHNLLQLLESRLDNIVYRAGLADTRAQARQLVNHGFFLVNGRKVNIPSFQCRVGDVVTIKENKKEKKIIKDLTAKWKNRKEIPGWLAIDIEAGSIKVVTKPEIDESTLLFDLRSIIEFYSR